MTCQECNAVDQLSDKDKNNFYIHRTSYKRNYFTVYQGTSKIFTHTLLLDFIFRPVEITTEEVGQLLGGN